MTRTLACHKQPRFFIIRPKPLEFKKLPCDDDGQDGRRQRGGPPSEQGDDVLEEGFGRIVAPCVIALVEFTIGTEGLDVFEQSRVIGRKVINKYHRPWGYLTLE